VSVSVWVVRALLALALLGVGYVIVSISIGEGGPQPASIGGINEVQQLYGGLSEAAAYAGDDEAPVTVTVFNDLQCSECAAFQVESIDPLVEPYVRPGEARLELIHLSVTQRMLTLTALASTAAGQQDRQWQYADLFARNFESFGETVDEQELQSVADSVPQFEVPAWEAALDDEEVRQIIEADAQLAIDFELGDEPGVVVEGPGGTEELLASPSAEEIAAAIEAVG